MSEGIKRLSNESRETPRWSATAFYRTKGGSVDVTHDFMELTELDELIERGPDWRSLDRVVIVYNGPAMTIEEATEN